MRALFTSLCTALSLLAMPLQAQCVGQNLLTTLPAAELADMRATAANSPFANGNYWLATRGDLQVHLIGTYHMNDPRHAATLARLAPVLATAKTLLVEAGPAEMAALKKRLAADPGLMVNTAGPTLPEALPPAVWQDLKSAMEARGVPGFMAAKLQPWYLSMLLSIPPCAAAEMGEGQGLDGKLIAAADTAGLPVSALEPYDTVFALFEAMTREDQLAMVTQALAVDDQSEDMSVTLADGYFAEESQLIWELMRRQSLKIPGNTPEQVAREMATMQEAVVNSRNRAWIPVILEAAEKGPLLVAFGALHLPGDQGVLNLLQAQGFTIERLEFR